MQLLGQHAHRRAAAPSAPAASSPIPRSKTASLVKPYSFINASQLGRRRAGRAVRASALRRAPDEGRARGQLRRSQKDRPRRRRQGHAPYLSGRCAHRRETNIGAGTITCNYDGVHKNPTTIGSRVFIGSDTALVAPVRVGDGAYVGAGSVITENVPAGALALARGRQVNKPGWAAARRRAMAAGAKPAKPGKKQRNASTPRAPRKPPFARTLAPPSAAPRTPQER